MYQSRLSNPDIESNTPPALFGWELVGKAEAPPDVALSQPPPLLADFAFSL